MTFRRAFVASMVGVTASLLVGLAGVSLADAIGGTTGPAIRTMGISIAGVVGVGVAIATLLFTGGRRTAGGGVYALSTLLGAAFLVWAGGRVPARPALVLSASDREELREFHDDASGVRGIEHPTLGFRLPHPTIALAPAPEMETEMRAASAPGWADAHEIWAFETSDHAVSVVIDLSRTERADRASLEALTRAVTDPLEVGGHRVERSEPRGHEGCWRERITAALTNGGRVDGDVFAFDDGARSLRLVVTVVTDGSGDWGTWTDDVSLACERGP